jgi:hypothetical protein
MEKVLKKPNSFCRIIGSIKIFFEKSFLRTKCFFSEIKTFSSFWTFFVTEEKIGDVGGDCCSMLVYTGFEIFIV